MFAAPLTRLPRQPPDKPGKSDAPEGNHATNGGPARQTSPARADPPPYGDADPAAYDEAVAALFARRPTRLVRGLDRIRAVTELLGNPQDDVPVVHLTGTNGKTSLARMVAALLRAQGLRVGTYTSPHLQDVRERVRVDATPIPRGAFLDLLGELRPVLDEVEARRGELVTFFEVMTALAYLHFARERVDAAVVEVGMGGRLDATNVACGRVAVLGPVGLDHRELGSRPAEIAEEKAGIVKPGTRTVVSARQEPGVAAVVDAAARRAGARLLVEGGELGVVANEPVPGGQRLELRGPTGPVRDAFLPLSGAHQAANATVAVAAAEAFLGAPLPPERLRRGLAAARSPGRLELVRRPGAPPVLLDGAHNPDAARSLADAVRSDFAPFTPRILVLGVLGDKDADGMASALLPGFDRVVLAPAPSVRAGTLDRLAAAVRARGSVPELADDVREALDRGYALAGPDGGLVVVTGSLYVVGAARDALGLAVT